MKRITKETKTKMVLIRLTETEHKDLKVLAAQAGWTATRVMVTALQEFIKRNE